ncbi:MAG: hypothetical protein AAF267_01385 [Deinococcota bacterium]
MDSLARCDTLGYRLLLQLIAEQPGASPAYMRRQFPDVHRNHIGNLLRRLVQDQVVFKKLYGQYTINYAHFERLRGRLAPLLPTNLVGDVSDERLKAQIYIVNDARFIHAFQHLGDGATLRVFANYAGFDIDKNGTQKDRAHRMYYRFRDAGMATTERLGPFDVIIKPTGQRFADLNHVVNSILEPACTSV